MVNNYYKLTAIGPRPIKVVGYQPMPAPREHSHGHRREEVSTCWIFPFDDRDMLSARAAAVGASDVLAALRRLDTAKLRHRDGEKAVELRVFAPRAHWSVVGAT